MKHLLWAVVVVAASCAGDEELIEGGEDMPGGAAAMQTNAMQTNAMQTNALLANRVNSDVLVTHPISTATFDRADINAAIATDPNSRITAIYLIELALPAGQKVILRDRTNPVPAFADITAYGVSGLCPQANTQPMDTDCKERLSAGLLARINAFGVKVRLSIRGEPTAMFALTSEVPALDTYPWTNDKVASLVACPNPTSGPRDCGWLVDRVGSCEPGTTAIASMRRFGGFASGGAMLRVCEGLNSCDKLPPPAAPMASPALCTSANPIMPPECTFQCPASGFFSVMKARYHTSVPVSMTTGGMVVNGWFPASEDEVLSFREAVFYGNIFGSGNFHEGWIDPTYDPKTRKWTFAANNVPYIFKAWVAADPGWTDARAYFIGRVCALQGNNCVASYVGKCTDRPAWAPLGICKYNDGPETIGDFDFQQITAPTGRVYKTGITTFLNDPCDIVPGACGYSGGGGL